MFAYIHPVGGGSVDPGFGIDEGRPHPGGGPIVLPPLPGIWPKPGEPNLPPVDPGFGVGGGLHPGGGPIIIPTPNPPDNAIPLPPGTIWPPLPPTTTGKYAILIWVIGVGTRWLIVDAGAGPDNTLPEHPQPKR